MDMDLTRHQAHLKVLQPLSGVRSRRMLGEWTEPVCINPQPSLDISRPFVVQTCPIHPLVAPYSIHYRYRLDDYIEKKEKKGKKETKQTTQFTRKMDHTWSVGHSDVTKFDEFFCEVDCEQKYVVHIHRTDLHTLVLRRQTDQKQIGTIELHEPVERVWWIYGTEDHQANLGVQTATGIHILIVDNHDRDIYPRPKGGTEAGTSVHGYESTAGPASLVRSYRWDENELDMKGPFDVYHVSSLLFAAIDAAFPSYKDEEEPMRHTHWIIRFPCSSKMELFLQPPKSNRMVHVRCVVDPAYTYVFQPQSCLQMKGVRHFWCTDKDQETSHFVLFAFHQEGFLLSWTFAEDAPAQHVPFPVLVSQPLFPALDGDHLRVQFVEMEDLQTVVYYTRDREHHTHLWMSVLTYDLPQATNPKPRSRKKQKRLLPHPGEQQITQYVQAIRSRIRDLPRATYESSLETTLFLLPELLQNAASWKHLQERSPSPYTQNAFEPHRQFLQAFRAVATSAMHGPVPLDEIMTAADAKAWFEGAQRFLQDVRVHEDLWKVPKQEEDDLGLSFMASKLLRLDGDCRARDTLVEWVQQVHTRSSEDTSASFTTFRLCMAVMLDVYDACPSETKEGEFPWKILERFDPMVWKLLLGDVASVHMTSFMETTLVSGMRPLVRCLDTMWKSVTKVAALLHPQWGEPCYPPTDMLDVLKQHNKCFTRVFRAVVETKAECWKHMGMYLDQDETMFMKLIPINIRLMCREMDLRTYYFLYYGNKNPPFQPSKEWWELFAFVPPSPHVREKYFDNAWEKKLERRKETMEFEHARSLARAFRESSDDCAHIKMRWKQGKLYTGSILDEWYAFFVDTLPVECLTHHRRLGQLFPTFTHLRLMGETLKN
mmetsp:Transcript_39718/g.102241  ORF Transcript_39718/g.102241 Transcript_39718/m.102241 type:complete len:882 (-) Transcript_39718:90-2735(-)